MKNIKILFVAVFDNEGISTNTSQAKGFADLGHEVFLYNYRVRSALVGGNRLRDLELIKVCKEIKPELVVFAKCNDMSTNVFLECKKTSTVCYWFPDPLVTYNYDEYFEKTRAAHIFCCDKKNVLEVAKKYNENSVLIHEGFDLALEKPRNVIQDINVSFIGNMYGDRNTQISQLEIPIKIFSNAFGEKHSEAVSRSKVNLNFCTDKGASDRVYKILAAGGFLISDDWIGRKDMLEDGKHCVIFKDIKDLKEKIKYYLSCSDERKKIADQGHEHIQKYSRFEWAKKVVENYHKLV